MQVWLDDERARVDCDALLGGRVVGGGGRGAGGSAPGVADAEVGWARGGCELGDPDGDRVRFAEG